MNIQVTQDDIDLGIQVSAWDCAVARAIRRQYPEKAVSVTGLAITIDESRFGTSDEMRVFIRDFDRDKTLVFPTEFLLDTSNPVGYQLRYNNNVDTMLVVSKQFVYA